MKVGCRVTPCVTAGEGGGMFGGVDRDCVFTSAGESGIVAAFASVLPAKHREKNRDGGGTSMKCKHYVLVPPSVSNMGQ